METSLRNAKLWGAEHGAAGAGRGQRRDLLQGRLDALAEGDPGAHPAARPASSRWSIGIEEVWNKFLLSPLEMARYVDEFASPWVKAYLDVGNMVFYGFPQDWIRTLGPRTVRVHLKDFKLDRPSGRFYWKNLGEGDVDWPEVRKALADVGYEGWVTTEIEGGRRRLSQGRRGALRPLPRGAEAGGRGTGSLTAGSRSARTSEGSGLE